MVEMEWDGEWWDAIVVKTIGCPDGKGAMASSNAAASSKDAQTPAAGGGGMAPAVFGGGDLPMFEGDGDLPMFGGAGGSMMEYDGAEGYYDKYTGEEEEEKKGCMKKGFKRTPTTILEVRLNKVSKEMIVSA